MYYREDSSIPITHERYDIIRSDYRKWWGNELGRPIAGVILEGCRPNRDLPREPMLTFSTAWDFSISPEQFIDAYDSYFSSCRYFGDAYPSLNTSRFGAGTAAALLGCEPISRKDTVWFLPSRAVPIKDLHFHFDPDSRYFKRIAELYRIGMERWHGAVVMAMLDIGGTLDILSAFRGAQNLLLDMYDAPEEVERCVAEIAEAWRSIYEAVCAIVAPEAEGYTDWFSIYSERPSYILQSDLSYMISPDMFARFVLPELRATSARLSHAVYHLDGTGELPHLDMLLKTDSIWGIQWVPGDGEASLRDWSDVVKRIIAAGKKTLLGAQNGDGTLKSCITDPNMAYTSSWHFKADDIEAAKRYGALYGIDVSL